jgi:hypothetical protein
MANHRQGYLWGSYTASHDVFDEYGLENCRMEVIEELPEQCSKAELYQREAYWIKNSPNCVNKICPRTPEEKKELGRRQAREWYKNNPDVKKNYYKEHKEDYKGYYELNKDKIKDYMKTQVKCPSCNKEMNRTSLSLHMKNQHDTTVKEFLEKKNVVQE